MDRHRPYGADHDGHDPHRLHQRPQLYPPPGRPTTPASKIADNALAAIAGRYDYALDAYMDGTAAGTSLYDSARASIDGGTDTAAYAADIALTLQKIAASPVENATGYTYTFTATITYTDDNNQSLTRSKAVVAAVAKRTPVVETEPAAGSLTYGQSLISSTLTDGSMKYTLNGSVPSMWTGTFSWKNSAIVPLGQGQRKALSTRPCSRPRTRTPTPSSN